MSAKTERASMEKRRQKADLNAQRAELWVGDVVSALWHTEQARACLTLPRAEGPGRWKPADPGTTSALDIAIMCLRGELANARGSAMCAVDYAESLQGDPAKKEESC